MNDRTPELLTLIVRRSIRATAEKLFDAWTLPEQLKLWWGPGPVVCTAAEVDLKVGGRYRIANQFPDGKVLWISGEFEVIERPKRLIYSWRIGAESGPAERVIVQFEPSGSSTEVIVTHERITAAAVRDLHQQGWDGCLLKLAKFSDSAVAQANSSAETPEKLGTPPMPTSSPGTKPPIPIKRMTDLQGQTRIFLSGGPPPKAK